jgi:hypothetical protein
LPRKGFRAYSPRVQAGEFRIWRRPELLIWADNAHARHQLTQSRKDGSSAADARGRRHIPQPTWPSAGSHLRPPPGGSQRRRCLVTRAALPCRSRRPGCAANRLRLLICGATGGADGYRAGPISTVDCPQWTKCHSVCQSTGAVHGQGCHACHGRRQDFRARTSKPRASSIYGSRGWGFESLRARLVFMGLRTLLIALIR